MKNLRTILTLMMVVAIAVTLVACGGENKDFDYATSVDGALVVAEAGSAGEELATANEFFANAKFTAVDSMATALMDVASGTSDIAIVDYVTSIGSIGEGTDFANLAVVEGQDFSPEEYGIAFRKGSDIVPAVNAAIAELMNDGTMDKIAADYKLDALLIKDGKAFDDAVTEGDLAYIKDKGELTIGITLFAPMNYEDENQELIGFETEFAEAVCAKLGVDANFVEINWNSKEIELNSKNIDCIWNGMTITEERATNMSISVPYMQNKQVMVAKTK